MSELFASFDMAPVMLQIFCQQPYQGASLDLCFIFARAYLVTNATVLTLWQRNIRRSHGSDDARRLHKDGNACEGIA